MSHYLRSILVTLSLLLSLSVNAQYNFSKVDKLLNEGYLTNDAVVLVYKKGKIIYAKEKGEYDIHTQKAVGSCGKWLMAALVMTYVDQGKLSLEDTIGKFLPIFTKNGKGSIKIKHCLTHTTGLESPPVIIDLLKGPNQFESLQAEVTHMALHYKTKSKPGEKFEYSGIGLNIAGRVLEAISHKDLDTLLQERIARPLGMKQTSFRTYSTWPANPSGGSVSTAYDYSQFLLMLLNNGTYNKKRILSKKAIQTMEIPYIPASDIKDGPSAAKYFNYGLGEWIAELSKTNRAQTICCPGIFGTWPLIDRKRGYTCIFFESRILNEETRKECIELKKAIDEQMTP